MAKRTKREELHNRLRTRADQIRVNIAEDRLGPTRDALDFGMVLDLLIDQQQQIDDLRKQVEAPTGKTDDT